MKNNIFTSPLDDYPGNVTAPSPYLAKHYKVWDKAVNEAKKKKNGFWVDQWIGLVSVCEVDIPAIKGKPVDEIPMDIIYTAVQGWTDYIKPSTDPKL